MGVRNGWCTPRSFSWSMMSLMSRCCSDRRGLCPTRLTGRSDMNRRSTVIKMLAAGCFIATYAMMPDCALASKGIVVG